MNADCITVGQTLDLENEQAEAPDLTVEQDTGERRTFVTPKLSFNYDKSFDEHARIDRLLKGRDGD